jgi:phosphoenolpyruvate carboxylase
MVDEVMRQAKKLDEDGIVDSVQNQNTHVDPLDRLQALVDRWRSVIPPGKDKLVKWKKVCELLAEVEVSLSELREGGECP